MTDELMTLESLPVRVRDARRGFTLVELMVALAIASVLLLALAAMFINTSAARTELDKSSRQIESGRYAMQIIAEEILHAGYFGALANAPTLPGSVTSLPDPCDFSRATIQATTMALPLQGYAGQTTASALDTGKLGCLDAAAGYKPNTAVLVVKRADTSIAAATPTAGFYNIQTSGCAGDTARYVLDSDTNAGNFTLHANTAPGCLPLTGAPAAKITPVYSRLFYISTCSDASCTAAGHDSVPTLKRIDVTPTGLTGPVALVDGIENMQFEYGIDTVATDGTPDSYVIAPSFANWVNVMAVRAYILARNVDATPGYTDAKTYVFGANPSFTPSGTDVQYRRHLYSETVRLNNPAGRRE
jgi:type IV pilus assembly protein PilW